MKIDDVSDTARWVAVYRAQESERPDAHFHDPFARRLAGPEGERIVSGMKRGRSMGWAMVVRTAVIDELVRDAVEGGVDTVVNLAAGLDARPWRMDLPAELSWVDVDLPAILDHKLDVIGHAEPRCRYRALRADLTDTDARRGALADATEGSAEALVLAEGLLIYLPDEAVAALAADLHATGAARWWIVDLASPKLLRWMERSWGTTMDGSARFRFAPEEGTAYFQRYGWREAAFRSTWDEAARLDRDMPMGWLWRFLTRLSPEARREDARRMSGVVLLERTGEG